MREARDVMLGFKVSEGDKRLVMAVAALEGTSMSDVIRAAVTQACRKRIASSLRDVPGQEEFEGALNA